MDILIIGKTIMMYVKVSLKCLVKHKRDARKVGLIIEEN